MNILFITTKSPLPTNDGHSLRTYNLLRTVAARHSVTLLSFVKFPVEYSQKGNLERICTHVSLLPLSENDSKLSLGMSAAANLMQSQPFVAQKYHTREMQDAIENQLNKQDFDLVHIDMLPLGCYLNSINKPILLNAHNVESALLKRKAKAMNSGISKWYFQDQASRLERFEQMVVSRVDHVAACSDEDRDLLQAMVPGTQVSVVPNGVDTVFYRTSPLMDADQNRLAFIGGMNWFPNKDAIVWFDDKIIGSMLQENHSLALDVVGRDDDGIKLQHSTSITMHGFVDDVRPYLDRAAVVIVPIRIGGGTRLKVLEAMSMGKAIVSTSIGVEGIRVEHGKHALIADTPEEFARCIQTLQNDSVMRQRLGQAARELVCSQYQWDAIGNRLLQAYDSLLGAFK